MGEGLACDGSSTGYGFTLSSGALAPTRVCMSVDIDALTLSGACRSPNRRNGTIQAGASPGGTDQDDTARRVKPLGGRRGVGRNVATLVDLPAADAPEIDPLDLDEVLRFLEAIRGHRLRPSTWSRS